MIRIPTLVEIKTNDVQLYTELASKPHHVLFGKTYVAAQGRTGDGGDYLCTVSLREVVHVDAPLASPELTGRVVSQETATLKMLAALAADMLLAVEPSAKSLPDDDPLDSVLTRTGWYDTAQRLADNIRELAR